MEASYPRHKPSSNVFLRFEKSGNLGITSSSNLTFLSNKVNEVHEMSHLPRAHERYRLVRGAPNFIAAQYATRIGTIAIALISLNIELRLVHLTYGP